MDNEEGYVRPPIITDQHVTMAVEAVAKKFGVVADHVRDLISNEGSSEEMDYWSFSDQDKAIYDGYYEELDRMTHS